MKMRTLIGGILLLIGFILYQTGISTALEQNQSTLKLVKFITSTFKIPLETDIVILVMEYLGGIIAILGLLICVSSLTTKEEKTKPLPKDKKPEKQLDPELQSAIEKTLKSS